MYTNVGYQIAGQIFDAIRADSVALAALKKAVLDSANDLKQSGLPFPTLGAKYTNPRDNAKYNVLYKELNATTIEVTGIGPR